MKLFDVKLSLSANCIIILSTQGETDRHTDRLTDRETNRHTDRQTYPKYTLVKARHKVGLWTTPFFSILEKSIISHVKKNTLSNIIRIFF